MIQQENKHIKISNESIYFKKREIGKGVYGTVYVTTLKNNVSVCVKECKKKYVGEDAFDEGDDPVMKRSDCRIPKDVPVEVFNEDFILQYLQTNDVGNHIIRVIDVIYEDLDTLFILELMDKSLQDWINECRMFPNRKEYDINHVRILMFQLLKSIEYMHSMGVIHRDLKSNNILLKKNNEKLKLKLCDFGISTID